MWTNTTQTAACCLGVVKGPSGIAARAHGRAILGAAGAGLWLPVRARAFVD